MSDPKFRTHLGDAARGLSQQMMLWGCDVRHSGGNALIRYGLEKRPSPGLQGTSCYAAPWEGGTIELHGAVASWTAPSGGCGCVFCRERKAIWIWSGGEPPIPGQDFALSGSPSQRWEAFQPLLRWLVRYEQWAAAHLSPTWRNQAWKSIKRLPKGKQWLPPSSALQWWTLALGGSPPRPNALLQS